MVNIKTMCTNWKNFVRMAIGLPPVYPVKIVRSEKAKKYPLLHIKKDGDVGYDLPSIERVVVPAPNDVQRNQYLNLMRRAEECDKSGYLEHADYFMKKALECLPKAIVPTGIKIEMPDTIWASIEARSSTSSKMMFMPDAIIDAGYRGELFVIVFNFGYKDYVIEEGERIAQVIFHQRILAKFHEVDALSPSERNESGFGSTGR